MNKKIICLTLVAMAIVLASFGQCLALDSLIVNINRAAFLTNPEDNTDSRMFVQFNLPSSLDTSIYITYAELRFGLTESHVNTRPLNIKACPITREWVPERLQWNGAWTNPGGDFFDSLGVPGIVARTDQSFGKIEISHLLMHYIRGNLANYGFVIKQAGLIRQSFAPTHFNANDNIAAQLAIYYVNLNRE